jgi:hypothetical protein
MSAGEYKDFRGKITARTWCFVEAEHRATGKDHQEIVREILDAWSERKHNAHIEADKLLASEGIVGEPKGAGRK